MDLNAANLTIRQAKEFLDLNGVPWSEGTIKAYVFFGKIPSRKIMNTRVIRRRDLERIIDDHKNRN